MIERWEKNKMATISKDNPVVTLINVFTVEPQYQQQVVDLLVEATETVMKHVPGYVSANIHKSLDGVRVVNYAQWESREAYQAIFNDPNVKVHMDKILKVATPDYHLYEVMFND
jgi:quinol monooxygenase YgiN